MKPLLSTILMVALSVTMAFAQDITTDEVKSAAVDTSNMKPGETIDTIYVYNSWNKILAHQPTAAYSGPIVYYNDEIVAEVYTKEDKVQDIIDKKMIAMCVGDTAWYLNSYYLLKNFKSDYRGFENYIPLYFTPKIAFVKFWDDYSDEGYLRVMPTADGSYFREGVRVHSGNGAFYVIDFVNKNVNKLDHKLLTALLDSYPDLQRRYLGMKKYKTREVIDFFFQKFIDKLSQDEEVPSIVEQIKAGMR